MTTNSIPTMSDPELLSATSRVASDERRTTAELLGLLAELDARRLYLGGGCSSLFGYCTITTTTVALLRPHLTPENHERLLAAARHKSKREVEHQIACLAPKMDVQSLVR
jgi:hypothetical protein